MLSQNSCGFAWFYAVNWFFSLLSVESLIESAFRVDVLNYLGGVLQYCLFDLIFSPLLKEDFQFDCSDRSKPPTIAICVQLLSICVC